MILGNFRVSYKKIVIQPWRFFCFFLTKIRDLIIIIGKKSEKTHLFVFTSGFGLNCAFRCKRSELGYYKKMGMTGERPT